MTVLLFVRVLFDGREPSERHEVEFSRSKKC